MIFPNGISLNIGKIAYELLYRGSSEYTIKYGIVDHSIMTHRQLHHAENYHQVGYYLSPQKAMGRTPY